MKLRNLKSKYGAKPLSLMVGVGAMVASGLASAASLIPTGTLTTLQTDLTDTFTEGMGFAYPLMLTFTGGLVAFFFVKRLIKSSARG